MNVLPASTRDSSSMRPPSASSICRTRALQMRVSHAKSMQNGRWTACDSPTCRRGAARAIGSLSAAGSAVELT